MSSPLRKRRCSSLSATSPCRSTVKFIAELGTLFEQDADETALRTLANRSLVVPDQEETAFALVPMVADFLRRKRPEVVAETGDRLEERAYALIVENGYERERPLPGARCRLAHRGPCLAALPRRAE